MNSQKQAGRQTPCPHAGQILKTNTNLAHLRHAIQNGKDLVVTGECRECAASVERRYSLVVTLPALAAGLLESDSPAVILSSEDLILEPWMHQENDIPRHLFMVHADVVHEGICGLSGMQFVGVNRGTRKFRYRCRCDFEWELSTQDLRQATIQGLHRSRATRRLAIE